MPESPVQENPAEQAHDAQEQGPDAAEAVNAVGETLAKLSQDPSVPDEAKAAFGKAMELVKAGLDALQGGGQGGGAVTPEQGASGAIPVSHGRPM